MSELFPEVTVDRAADLFRALSDPTRLRILNALSQHGEVSVSDLAAQVATSQSNVSRHLRVLHQSRLVIRRRDGASVYFSIADGWITALCALVCNRVREQVTSDAAAFDPH